MFDPTAMGAMGEYHLPAEVRIIDRAALRIHTSGWVRASYRKFDEEGQGIRVCAIGAIYNGAPGDADVIHRSELVASKRAVRVLARLACERSWLTRHIHPEIAEGAFDYQCQEAVEFYNDIQWLRGKAKILKLLADARDVFMAEHRAYSELPSMQPKLYALDPGAVR